MSGGEHRRVVRVSGGQCAGGSARHELAEAHAKSDTSALDRLALQELDDDLDHSGFEPRAAPHLARRVVAETLPQRLDKHHEVLARLWRSPQGGQEDFDHMVLKPQLTVACERVLESRARRL